MNRSPPPSPLASFPSFPTGCFTQSRVKAAADSIAALDAAKAADHARAMALAAASAEAKKQSEAREAFLHAEYESRVKRAKRAVVEANERASKFYIM